MKRFQLGVLLTGLTLGGILLSGCAKETGAETNTQKTEATGVETGNTSEDGTGKIKVFVTAKNMADPFHSWLCNSTTKALEEKYQDVEYKVVDLMADPANTQSIFDQCEVEGYNALILDKVSNSQDTDQWAQAFKEKGISVVITNNCDIKDGVSSSSGASHYLLGHAAGEAAAAGLSQNAKCLAILSTPGDSASEDRWKGYQDALKEAGRDDVEILDVKNNETWAKEKAMKIMEDWLQIYPEIDAVLAMNDGMALGCVEACKADGKDVQTMQFYGIDGLADSCMSIADGEMTASVLQDAADMGANAARLAVDMAEGKITEPEEYLIQPIIVDSENVSDIIEMHKANGFIQ